MDMAHTDLQQLMERAGQGDADAQNNLGCMYEQGRGVTQDAQETVRWFKKAAEQGQADAIKALRRLGNTN